MDVSTRVYDYLELVQLTAKGIPTFDPLREFLEANVNLACKISLIEFEDDNDEQEQNIQKNEDCKKEQKSIEPRKIETCELENELDILRKTDGHRLLLIENLTPKVITLLGNYWNVPPDFFLAHLENSNWYKLQNIPQNLPGLSSVQSLDGFVRFQFIGPRELGIKGPPNPQPPGSPRDHKFHNLLPDRIDEDPHTASVPRVAGGFTPFSPPPIDDEDASETRLNPVAFVRNSITIWFDKEGDKWRKGIVLFDPPFVAKDPSLRKRDNSKYRSFIRRQPPPYFSDDDIDHRPSYKESFEKCLRKNQDVKEIGLPKPFVLLKDLCRIIASEWLVFNTYIERELNNIEGWFERLGENCPKEQLHDLLHQLMRARRRVTKYDTLVSDQLQLCPAHWRHESSQDATCPVTSTAQSSASNKFSSPLQDFHQVSDHLAHNKARISQAIKMATSLMAVRLNNLMVNQNEVAAKQNKLSEARNSSLAFLTGVASFLLPFTTVAAFMAIPSDSGLGPGSKNQWIYWVSSGILALTLVLAFVLDYRWENWKVNRTGEEDEHGNSLFARLFHWRAAKQTLKLPQV